MQDDNKAVTSKVEIHVFSIIKEAWQITKGLRLFIWIRIVLATLSAAIIIGGGTLLLSFIESSILFLPLSLLVELVGGAVAMYIFAPAIIAGIRRAAGLEMDFNIVKGKCKTARKELIKLILTLSAAMLIIGYTPVLFTAMAVFIGPTFGFIMFILTLLLSMTINSILTIILPLLAIPLTVLRKFDYKKAIKRSFMRFRIHWFRILLCIFMYTLLVTAVSILMGVITALVFFLSFFIPFWLSVIFYLIIGVPMLIIYLYIVPVYYAMNGILFRQIMQLKAKKLTDAES